MNTRWRPLSVVSLVLVFASACSNDAAPPAAPAPEATAAPDTDPDELDFGESTAESAQPAPTKESDTPESEPTDAEETTQEAAQLQEESALDQLRRRMAAAAAFGGLVPSMAIVEELRRNAEGFSYAAGCGPQRFRQLHADAVRLLGPALPVWH